jgi:hypothetical protein
MSSRALVWFRNDLRIADHPALHAALSGGTDVLALFIHEEGGAQRTRGAAARWWLHHSLNALAGDLAGLGVPLHIVEGPADRVVPDLIAEHGISDVYWNRRYGPAEREADGLLKASLRGPGDRGAELCGQRPGRTLRHGNRRGQALLGVHPVLEGTPGARDPAAPAPARYWSTGPTKARRGHGLCRAAVDREAHSSTGGSARPQPRNNSSPSSKRQSATTPGRATCRGWWAPPACRHTLRSERSVRDRSGMQHSPGRTARRMRRRHRQVPLRTGLAGLQLPPVLSPAGHRNGRNGCQVPGRAMALRRCRLRSVDAGPDRLSHRRCGHARTVANRDDAQPGSDAGGIAARQEPADRLAAGRRLVLGYAGRCRRGQQSRELAVGSRVRPGRLTLFPHLQSGDAG